MGVDSMLSVVKDELFSRLAGRLYTFFTCRSSTMLGDRYSKDSPRVTTRVRKPCSVARSKGTWASLTPQATVFRWSYACRKKITELSIYQSIPGSTGTRHSPTWPCTRLPTSMTSQKTRPLVGEPILFWGYAEFWIAATESCHCTI